MANPNYQFNTVLVTGGAGGIGRALAEHFISKGKKVVICGRTKPKLQVTAKEIGCTYLVLDTSDIPSIAPFVKRVVEEYPDLGCVVNNAGIQKKMNFNAQEDHLGMMDAELDTNIKGVLHLTMHLLPQIRAQKGAIYNVGSGLGFTPASSIPVYSATKAFIHSWSWSLRAQLWSEGVKVVEIIPPLVETDLHRDHDNPEDFLKGGRTNPMPMETFMEGVVADLEAGKEEVTVGALWKGLVDKAEDLVLPMFEMLNGDVMKAAGREQGLIRGQTVQK